MARRDRATWLHATSLACTSELGFLQLGWQQLRWTAWAPLADRQALRVLPATAGFYRIGVAGRTQLAYVGQTGRSLRGRIQALAHHALGEAMPWNDPHTAAPGLWCYRYVDGLEFDVSVAVSDVSRRDRLGQECALLWRYRCETGCSPLLNLGHFHNAYCRPSNRAQQRSMRPQPAALKPNTRARPLALHGEPEDPRWMELAWSAAAGADRAPEAAGLYRLIAAGQVVYIGEAGNLRNRLLQHVRGRSEPFAASWVRWDDRQTRCPRLELECDLIGAFFQLRRCAPAWQFGEKDTSSALLAGI